jgi:hypothetical protein
MRLSEVGNNAITVSQRARRFLSALRPGAVLAIAVAGVVGIAGLLQWNQELMVIGLIAGLAIVSLNVVGVAVRRWHRRNTTLAATYSPAEEVVRLRSPRAR